MAIVVNGDSQVQQPVGDQAGGTTRRWRLWRGRDGSGSQVDVAPRRLLEGVPQADGVPRRAQSAWD